MRLLKREYNGGIMKTMTTATGIAVALAVAVALGFMFVGPSVMMPFTSTESPTIGTMNDELNVGAGAGTGEPAKAGDRVSVNYVGRFENGTVFDASANHGGPFTFTLGAGEVIKGWDQGVIGMRAGEKRQLVVPPELGYGPNDYGPIPGNSTLIFDIEVMSIESAN